MARVEARGGPADGLTVRDAGAWRWLDATAGRGFARPRSGRALYRREGGGYVFAGHSTGHCEGCGGFVDAEKRCPLCGGRVTA